jgi:hypothetical protein
MKYCYFILFILFLIGCGECYCPAKYSRKNWNAVSLEMDTSIVKNILGEPFKRLPFIDTLNTIVRAAWIYRRDSVYYKNIRCKCANSKWLHFDERWRVQEIEEFSSN